MRFGFDRLAARIRGEMQQDPESGSLFIFANRRATRLKVLWRERHPLFPKFLTIRIVIFYATGRFFLFCRDYPCTALINRLVFGDYDALRAMRSLQFGHHSRGLANQEGLLTLEIIA